MKGFLLLVVATLAAIGAGIGIESTDHFGPPEVVLAAIERTMAVSSLDVTLAPSDPPSGYQPTPLATYNAPDRYEVREGILKEREATPPTIFIGDREYVGDPAGTAVAGRAARYLELLFEPTRLLGLNGEQLQVFPEMQSLRSGADFKKTASGYSFRLFVTETIRPKDPSLAPVRPVVVRFTGGSVVLHAGYIRQLTVDELTDGHASGTSVTYSDLDHAPMIERPTATERCSSFPLRTSEGEICAALASGKD